MPRWLVLSFVCALVVECASAADEFPYRARVAVELAAVRSGPGKVHYATDQLTAGAIVEVYRHDPGDWCAIRPPDGSFSWLEAKHLSQPGDDSVAEVLGGEATAWVGSRLDNIDESMWQVRLRPGEAVAILGQETRRDPRTGQLQLWYKIAPPSGEFRWIHSSQIERVETNESATDAVEDKLGNVELVGHTDSNSQVAEATTASPDGFVARQSNAREASAGGHNEPSPPATFKVVSAPIGDEELNELAAIDAELSRTVARDPAIWDLAELDRRAAALLTKAETPDQRQRAKQLLDRILAFNDFQRRWRAAKGIPPRRSGIAPSLASDEETEETIESLTDADVAATSDQETLDPRFDGSGWLLPVHSRRADLPRYVLMSEDGRVLQYVTPVPGFNLHRYLNHKIGVHGQRGFIPQINAPHVTAQHVKVLQRR